MPSACAAAVRFGEVLVGAEVRVDGREVEPPVAVVGAVPCENGLLLQHRRHPERREAEVVDALQVRGQPLQVAAVVEARVGRVEAGLPRGPVRPPVSFALFPFA